MKKVIIIALCFMASFKASSQVIDTTMKDCIAAKLKTGFVITGEDFKKDTATHFAFIQDVSTVDKWTVTFALRSKKENFVIKVLELTRADYEGWDGYYESLLLLLLTKFNLKYGLSLQF